MDTVRVALADEHPIVRLGMRHLLDRDRRNQIVGEPSDASDLVQCCESADPDILIVDYHLPGSDPYGDGLRLIGYILRRFPHLRLLVFTAQRNPPTLARLYEMGVSAVVQKHSPPEQLLHVLATVARGESHRAPLVQPLPACLVAVAALDRRIASLSSKEFEVLRLFVSGYRVSDIASLSNRSVKTVSAQKSSAMRKLSVDSDQALLVFCVEARMFT